MVARVYLTRKQVAELFGVSLPTVTRWAREGRLPSIVTPGGQHRYPREQIEHLVETFRRTVPYGAVTNPPP